MTKENRIKLGKEWKRRILENKKLPAEKQLRVPKGITLSHPYILEAEGKVPTAKGKEKKDTEPKKAKAKKDEVEEPKVSDDDEGTKLADKYLKGGK